MLEDILFNASDIKDAKDKKIVIDGQYVIGKLKDIKDDENLRRYIL